MRVEQTFSNDDRETRDLVSMGWRGMPSFSTVGSIVCTQLAVARQADLQQKVFSTPLEATGRDSLFGLVKCHKLQRKEIGITVPFKKNLKPTQTMQGWGQNPKSQWHSFSVKQNVCVFFGGSLHRL